jgi:protease-4
LIKNLFSNGNHVYLEFPSKFNDSHKSFFLKKIQGESENPFFTEFLDQLILIRKDNRVKHLTIFVPKMEIGFSEIQTIYRELELMKSSGIQLQGYSEEGDIKTIFLLSICDKRISSGTAEFFSILPSTESMFFGEVAKKWKVKVDVFQSGPYKSFGEIFTRKEFSKEARSNLSELVQDLKNEIVQTIEKNSSLKQETLQHPILTSNQLKELGFFHELIEIEGFKKLHSYTNIESISKELDGNWKLAEEKNFPKPDTKILSIRSILSKDRIKNFKIINFKKPRILILPLKGEISEGKIDEKETKSGAIERHSLLHTIDEIKNEKNISAIILEIDSPGGSAIDSEKIFLKLKELDKNIPVYAFLSNTCASGGYYLACSARKIFSNSIGIVGSIGTIMLRFDMEGLYNHFGVTKDRIGFYPKREIFSDSGKLSKESQLFLKNEISRVESLFLKRVQDSRKIETKVLSEMSGGKVFSPQKFINKNFIDQKLTLTETLEWIQNDLKIKQPIVEYLAPQFNVKLALRTAIPFATALIRGDWNALANQFLPLLKKSNSIYFYNPTIKAIQHWIR